MNTIDSSFESSLSRLNSLKGQETQRKSPRPLEGEEIAKEIVTEKNVTEVSLNIMGLDFRKITSAEKQYTKMVSKNASQKKEASTAAEGEIWEAEVLPIQKEDEQHAQESKIHRAYLLKEPANRTLRYLA